MLRFITGNIIRFLIIVVLATLTSCGNDEPASGIRLSSQAVHIIPPRLIAHRGLWNYPGSAQNSLASIRLAFEEPKFRGAEIDIWMTSDGQLILNHGDEIDGMKITETPFNRLRECRLANGEPIPTFEEALALLEDYPGKVLMLDIKSHCVDAMADILKDFPYIDQLIFKSFSPGICEKLISLGFSPVYLLTWDINSVDINHCVSKSYTGVSAYIKPFNKNSSLISELHDKGLSVIIWEANTNTDVENMLMSGADLVVTDCKPVKRK